MAGLQIPNPSITTNVFEYDEAGRVSAISGHPLAGEGGGTVVKSDLMWKPTVGSDGYVHWTLASSATTPEAAYISGAQGPQGPSGTNGKDGTDGKDGTNGISPTFTIAPTAGGTHVTISGAQGEDSFDILSGAKGADGTNGFSPTVSTTTTASEDRTGTVLTFTYGDEGGQTVSYTAWNGKDGTGASYDFDSSTISGDGSVNSKYGLDTTAAMNLTHTSAYSAIHAADALSSTSAYIAQYYYKAGFEPQNIATAINNIEQANTQLIDDVYSTPQWLPREDPIYADYAMSAYIGENNVSSFNDFANAINAKLDTTAAAATYQPKGNYASASDIAGMATQTWVREQSYLPTSGGTVSGQLVISATSANFDSQFLKFVREGNAGHGRIGLGTGGPLALKVDDANNHTTQVNISPNATNDQLVQVQHGGTTAYLIPAVTATTTAGLTDDGILHIIVEN